MDAVTQPNSLAVAAAADTAVALTPPNSQPAALQRLAALPMKRKISLGAGVVALIALLVVAFAWPRETQYQVLFSNVSDKEGGTIIAALTQMNVPYRFTPGGAAIMVPEQHVHETRLKLASQGLPRGGTVGFELMENQKFGTTQFQERVNFQRGLEGELARSIQSLAAVESARVHLALPAQNGFLREQHKPSASVLLTMHPGRQLDRAQVDGIVHLVASSVPQLTPKLVSVVDQSGELLSSRGENPTAGKDSTQLEYVRRIEASLNQRVLGILEPIVGEGNVRAQVAADVDFTQSESTAEQYRPNQSPDQAAIRSQQMVDDRGLGLGNGVQGVPGAMSNQPPPQASAPINGTAQQTQAAGAVPGTPGALGANGIDQTQRRESLTNYEVDKTVQVTRNATGTIKRLSAAIVVNHRRTVDAEGKVAFTPLSQAEIDNIQALVREAIGLNKDRGDSINVVNAAFTETDKKDDLDIPLWKQPESIALARDLGKQLALIVIALIVVFFLIRPSLKAMNKKDEPGGLNASVDDPLQLPSLPGLAYDDDPAAAAKNANAQMESLLKIGREDPATVANVVRQWIGIENKGN